MSRLREILDPTPLPTGREQRKTSLRRSGLIPWETRVYEDQLLRLREEALRRQMASGGRFDAGAVLREILDDYFSPKK